MAGYDIVIDINLEDYADIIRKSKALPNAIDDAILDAILQGADDIEHKLHKFIAEYGLAGSSIDGSVVVIPTEDSITIDVLSDHADFVEFGTGIVGSEHPHPNPMMNGWIYDTNNHGNKGWWYPSDGGYAWTKGMPSRPFMYRTYQYAENIIPVLIKKNIRKIKV